VAPNSGGLYGPRGILFQGGNLLVVNQNVGQPFPGEILSYDGISGAFQKQLVPSSDPYAPWAPRGLILGGQANKSIYLANLTTSDDFPAPPGTVNIYGTTTGNFIGGIQTPAGFPTEQFHPRSVVFGPDGLLYTSSRTLIDNTDNGGWVLRFNPDGSFHDVFISDAGGPGHLNSPEGLVFGPDGNLYITSLYTADAPENSIRIYNSTGQFLNEIILGAGPAERSLALLFGPGGNLFVPILGSGQSVSQLRSYDIYQGYDKTTYKLEGDSFITPWYLTFKNTDPHTLNYVATPVPASVVLLGSGLLGLLGLRRRYRS